MGVRWKFGFLGVVLTGCAPIQELREDINGLTETLVLEALVLGVLPPDGDDIALDGTELEVGTSLQAVLVDADGSVALDDMVPLDGAGVTVLGDPMGQVQATPLGAGTYGLAPGEGLEYSAGAFWTLSVTPPRSDDEPGAVEILLPPPPNVSIPSQMDPGTSIALDLGGQQFHATWIQVVDTFTGMPTFTSGPVDLETLYEAAHTDAFVGPVDIPGIAFTEPSVYAVAVGGLAHHDDTSIDGLNTAFTGVLAGQVRVFPVSTLPVPP